MLAELTAVDRTTLNHTIRLMVASRIVRREASGLDRRSVALKLTALGRRRLVQILPVVTALNDRCLMGLGAAEVRALVGQMRHMTENLDDRQSG